MKGTTQIVKGRLEEAAGALTGNNKLRNKGQADQNVGQVKKVVEKGVRKINDSIKEIVDKTLNIRKKDS